MGPSESATTVQNQLQAVLTDVNGDGKLDMIRGPYENIPAGTIGPRSLSVAIGNGDGSFKVGVTYAVGGPRTDPNPLSVSDFNGDGRIDIICKDDNDGTSSVLLGNGDGSFKARMVLGVEVVELFDANDDGKADILASDSVWLGNGDGTFAFRATFSNAGSGGVIAGDLNRDGVQDIIGIMYGGLQQLSVMLGNSSGTPRAPLLDLTSVASARSSLDLTRSLRERLSAELGVVGAMQSRLSVAARNLSTQRENSIQASSRITDVDIAAETALSVASTIRQEMAASVTLQANSSSSLVLQLISD